MRDLLMNKLFGKLQENLSGTQTKTSPSRAMYSIVMLQPLPLVSIMSWLMLCPHRTCLTLLVFSLSFKAKMLRSQVPKVCKLPLPTSWCVCILPFSFFSISEQATVHISLVSVKCFLVYVIDKVLFFYFKVVAFRLVQKVPCQYLTKCKNKKSQVGSGLVL